MALARRLTLGYRLYGSMLFLSTWTWRDIWRYIWDGLGAEAALVPAGEGEARLGGYG